MNSDNNTAAGLPSQGNGWWCGCGTFVPFNTMHQCGLGGGFQSPWQAWPTHVQQGWQCPACKRCYSPIVLKCEECGPRKEKQP